MLRIVTLVVALLGVGATAAATPTAPTPAGRATLAAYAATAQRIYHQDLVGSLGRSTRTHLVDDAAFVHALKHGDIARARSRAATLLQDRAASLTVLRGGRTLFSVDPGFDVAPSIWTLSLGSGPPVTLQIAAQTMAGFAQLAHQVTGAQVFVRDDHGHHAGTVAGADRSGWTSMSFSEPGAPGAGNVTISVLAADTGLRQGGSAADAHAAAVVAVAQRIYGREANSIVPQADLRTIATNRPLIAALGANRRAAAQRAGGALLVNHIVSIRVANGSRTLLYVNPTFAVDGPTTTIRGPGGRSLGRLQITVQDVLGYTKLVVAEIGVQIVVHGSQAGHVMSSLPAATHRALPGSGAVTIAGQGYAVRSFRETGFAGEKLRVWLLIPTATT